MGSYLLVLAVTAGSVTAGDVDFNRDVRPILSNHCFKCHGPDSETREADLRLDQPSSATAENASGARAIVAGDSSTSELVRRILSEDADEMMPPPAANKPLTDADREILKRWIDQGADYQPHWAFEPPSRPALARYAVPESARHPIDLFVAHRLDQVGLTPSPLAAPDTIVRRLYLDLIGIPPSPAEAEQFRGDPNDDAVDRLVDRLLASPQYGERWARRWLDLARYADTNGYEKDNIRSIWPYRDWVINAINRGMPFDQFTVEQLAGDMLPGASLDQRIATGFHRNTMLNEEGGIDPLEFRFHSLVDRVSTTGTVWMGLTVGCAQCHTHKYDPITQEDYYRVMAFFDNADEPEMPLPSSDITAQRTKIDEQLARLNLADQFPLDGSDIEWTPVPPLSATSDAKTVLESLQDFSLRATGPVADKESTVVVIDSDLSDVVGLRIEVLADPTLPEGGPGRAKNGNFVLSGVHVSAAPREQPEAAQAVPLTFAEANRQQDNFPAGNALNADPKTGWGVGQPNNDFHHDHWFQAQFDRAVSFPSGTRWTIKLDQQYGGSHVLGRFRISLGRLGADWQTIAISRRQHFDRQLDQWVREEARWASKWTPLVPTSAESNLPYLTILDDATILSTGDQTKSDTYNIHYPHTGRRITAVRLEALADERLPVGGPGRVYYEGPLGDFYLSEFQLKVDGQPVSISRAVATYSSGVHTPDRCFDGNPQSGWSIDGAQGQTHIVIFELAEPIDVADAFDLKMIFERHFSCGLGRFRVSVTSDLTEGRTKVLPAEVEDRLARIDLASPIDASSFREAFIEDDPRLAGARQGRDRLRKQRPEYPTTLVMRERPDGFSRTTHVHKRGEYLQPTKAVVAEIPSLFEGKSAGEADDRLSFARWLVHPQNPLTARVTVNRHWQTIFGQGIVKTTEDFGYQGAPPTHPGLLDWLAVEFVEQGWQVKELHRQIVTSSTYLQSSAVTADRLEQDPVNALLSRGPRNRLEAELIRDTILASANLISLRIGGPSVFPPQPASITKEGAYGPLDWRTSTGGDRYRRGLYTFAKRTAPYAMFGTFDGPSGEACVARREVSNTPLQSLTLLNDEVILEAARELGRQLALMTGSADERLNWLFQQCLVRAPTDDERRLLRQFYDQQQVRLARGELSSSAINPGNDSPETAAWTLVARGVLNLDEMITKE